LKNRIIPELKQADAEYRKERNKARKAYEKLKKLEKKYFFLDRIVQPRKDTDTKKDDVELEWAIFDLFESIGFNCKKPESERDVDVKAKFKNYYFGIEVKNGNLVGENELFQAHKYKGLHNEIYHPIIVYNNTKNNDNFDENRIKIALKNNFGIILTTELKKGYLKLKNNRISFAQFIKQLDLNGEIKFSNKELSRSDKSEASR
jgi:hypothetical protein